MRTIRWAAWLLVALFIGGAIALYASEAFRTQVAGSSPGAAIGGDFTMVSDEGQTVSEEDFLGKPTIYFFGYTHCPDVCPTTLFELTNRLAAMGDDQVDQLNAVFVSVDPDRDTPAEMHKYLEAFDTRIVGLTGSADQTKEMMQAFRVYAAKVPTDDGDYTMDHSAALYLMDADGNFVGTISPSESDETAIKKMQNLVS